MIKIGNSEIDHANLVGNKVKATRIKDQEYRYLDSAIAQRIEFNGKIGKVIDYSNSHELCYKIKFKNGYAWYDIEELELV